MTSLLSTTIKWYMWINSVYDKFKINLNKESDLYKQTRTAGISGLSKNIKLNGNSYNGISIGLSDLVNEDWNLIIKLINLVESFSFYLFEETGNR